MNKKPNSFSAEERKRTVGLKQPCSQVKAATGGGWPDELAALKLLGHHAKTGSVEPQQLHPICGTSTEDEYAVGRYTTVARQRLRQLGQLAHAFAHVHQFGVQKHLAVCRPRDHGSTRDSSVSSMELSNVP